MHLSGGRLILSATHISGFTACPHLTTLVFAALFTMLDGPFGPVAADVVALASCALLNTAANRRLTFALRGRVGRARHYLAGLAVGFWQTTEQIAAQWTADRIFQPQIGQDRREEMLKGWRRAVGRARDWATE